jgi:hypothetical protein
MVLEAVVAILFIRVATTVCLFGLANERFNQLPVEHGLHAPNRCCCHCDKEC